MLIPLSQAQEPKWHEEGFPACKALGQGVKPKQDEQALTSREQLPMASQQATWVKRLSIPEGGVGVRAGVRWANRHRSLSHTVRACVGWQGKYLGVSIK